jgi:hypothetical protein
MESGGAFLDLGPAVAETDGAIQDQLVIGIVIDAIETESFEMVLSSTLRILDTRFYLTVVQYLQRIRI